MLNVYNIASCLRYIDLNSQNSANIPLKMRSTSHNMIFANLIEPCLDENLDYEVRWFLLPTNPL